MDLKQLEHFVALAEERHFTRASRGASISFIDILLALKRSYVQAGRRRTDT